jgi:hypothetical protein
MLLLARLGQRSPQYIADHRRHTLQWHRDEGVLLNEERGPYILSNNGASNCSYITFPKVGGRFDWQNPTPVPLEPGMAIGHLLSIGGLQHMHSHDRFGPWEGLTSDVSCHEWWNGVRFLAVPAGADWAGGVDESPNPHDVLRQRWQQLMRPIDDAMYVPPRLYLLERVGDEWFTRYPKPPGGERMDESDVELHVRSVHPVGGTRQFQVDEMFFLRYDLSQVMALAPAGVNAYLVTDVSPKDSQGKTTVVVQFFEADVDTSQRLPREKEIKQDYDLLMG